MDTVVGWAEWIIRVCGELYHGEICNIHEMFAVVVALIYREALFDRADVIVLCAAYLGLKRSVAEVAHNHAVLRYSSKIGHDCMRAITSRLGAGSVGSKMPAC